MEPVLKKIGIVGNYYKGRFCLPFGYSKFASKYGKVVPIIPSIYTEVDLLILPGGADVDPYRYGEHPEKKCGFPDYHLERFDKYILPKYIENRIPILGICRGHQTLAVYFGLKLCQHFDHPNYDIVTYKDDWEIVNSFHHQHVIKDHRKDIKFYKNEIGTVEAMEYKKYPIKSVQWHPERMKNCPISHNFIQELLYGKTDKESLIYYRESRRR